MVRSRPRQRAEGAVLALADRQVRALAETDRPNPADAPGPGHEPTYDPVTGWHNGWNPIEGDTSWIAPSEAP